MESNVYYLVCVGLTLSAVAHTKTNTNNEFNGFTIPCKDTSAQCLKDSIQAVLPEFVRGIPSLGIPQLDPFKVDKVNMSFPGGLNIEFRDGYSKGLRKCIIDSASVNHDQYDVTLHCNFTITGKYRSHGKMLMFPIDGVGDATIICKNIKIKCTLKVGTTAAREVTYLQIKEFDVKHAYEGQVHYKISNLFKGNPEIGNMVLQFMNQNWLTVAEEFGDPIVNFGIDSVFVNVKKLIKMVPKDRLIKNK